MRKTLLASASAAMLALGGAAFADQAQQGIAQQGQTAGQQADPLLVPGAGGAGAGAQTGTGADVGAAGTQAGTDPLLPGAGTDATSPGATAGTTGTMGTDAAAGTAGTAGTGTDATGAMMPGATAAMDDEQEFRSHAQLGDQFDGEIAGGFEADELMDKRVVDSDGEEIGTIADLLVGEGDRVERVLIELEGDEERRVAVRLDDLQRAEGDVDELVLSRSKDELGEMTAYEREDDRWRARTGS